MVVIDMKRDIGAGTPMADRTASGLSLQEVVVLRKRDAVLP